MHIKLSGKMHQVLWRTDQRITFISNAYNLLAITPLREINQSYSWPYLVSAFLRFIPTYSEIHRRTHAFSRLHQDGKRRESIIEGWYVSRNIPMHPRTLSWRTGTSFAAGGISLSITNLLCRIMSDALMLLHWRTNNYTAATLYHA